MAPAVSIVIVTYNSAAHVRACLRAVGELAYAGDREVVVVDNGSADDSAAVVAAACPGARLIRAGENLGFAGGVNRGVAEARGEVLALLNPDAAPERDWLSQLVDPLADATIGVVGSKVLGSDGRIQSLGSTLDWPLMLSAHRGDGTADNGQHDALADVWSVHGAAMGFRREVWERLGGFDEGFFPAYWEESDFCERARRAGLRVMVAPRAVVRHHEATATGKYSAEFYFYYHRNRLRYAAKWLDWPELWGGFRPAEHARLAQAPPLDRRVARVAYAAGLPPAVLDASGRAAVLATGRGLREGRLPDDGFAAIERQLAAAEASSVLEEVRFTSRVPLVARLRAAWNDVATRWYVRPSLDQQTRFNLAAGRALAALAEQAGARAAADALDVALLAWRLGATEASPRP
jgi:GT2 family glycosyltransferase